MDKIFGIIGYPVAHSLSPRLFDAAYHGKYRYKLIETPSFEEAWSRFIEGPYLAVNVTAPFKEAAFKRAMELAGNTPGLIGEEVLRTSATNILVKTESGIAAHNSDFLGVAELIKAHLREWKDAAVIGFGGAGKAAAEACRSLGLNPRVYHHNQISEGVKADLIIFTCPRQCEGTDRFECKALLEANYKDPCLSGHPGYIPGTAWHLAQALCGYTLMSGEEPDAEEMKKIYVSF